ncbi:hypothetical protein FRC12_007386 [Ceratobasidium sp. 428]|nr:hypothetical protein FRC12_007386 [Ceratobasidium sp. 428]
MKRSKSSKGPLSKKKRLLSPNSDSWFSEEYIERDGRRYRCLICPTEVSGGWRDRHCIRKHQTFSVTHNQLIEQAKQQIQEDSPQETHLVLYYPSNSPGEPVEDATAVYYELSDLESNSGLDEPTSLLEAEDKLEGCDQKGCGEILTGVGGTEAVDERDTRKAAGYGALP